MLGPAVRGQTLEEVCSGTIETCGNAARSAAERPAAARGGLQANESRHPATLLPSRVGARYGLARFDDDRDLVDVPLAENGQGNSSESLGEVLVEQLCALAKLGQHCVGRQLDHALRDHPGEVVRPAGQTLDSQEIEAECFGCGHASVIGSSRATFGPGWSAGARCKELINRP